jgi:hypothetical protein
MDNIKICVGEMSCQDVKGVGLAQCKLQSKLL